MMTFVPAFQGEGRKPDLLGGRFDFVETLLRSSNESVSGAAYLQLVQPLFGSEDNPCPVGSPAMSGPPVLAAPLALTVGPLAVATYGPRSASFTLGSAQGIGPFWTFA
ncbi:hypothetical protein [Streptomyces niveus]|uniref:hypothetical protein n=1 Tax=Streptomyces niveus TaxID=193462 RepID=UPI003699683A